MLIQQNLQRLEDLLKQPQHRDIQDKLIEDIFIGTKDSRTSKFKDGNIIDELVLVREMGRHFSKVTDLESRNRLFISLFHPSHNDQLISYTQKILAMLISFAIVTNNIGVLDASAVWMQQVCCLSPWCENIAYVVVQDFFQMGSKTPPHFTVALKALPSATPLFTANFITSCSQLFFKVGSSTFDEPPVILLEMIILWLKSSPSLALSPLMHSLPGVSLSMTPDLPIAPLVRWCVEAPFVTQEDQINTAADMGTSDDAYSELHLCLLQSLQDVPSITGQMSQMQVLCPKYMADIVERLRRRMISSDSSPKALEVSMNRLAQILLVGLRMNAVPKTAGYLWSSIKALPFHNRLMSSLLSSLDLL